MTARLEALYTALLLGELPAWPTHEMISAGEELRDVVRDRLPQADDDAEELERIGQSLIDFGALDKDDRITGYADLIDALLPPGSA